MGEPDCVGPRGRGEVWAATVGSGGTHSAWRMSLERNRKMAGAQRANIRKAFSVAPFPLYGLPPDWPGPRHLGGLGQSWPWPGRRWGNVGSVNTASLLHGANESTGPALDVESRSPDAPRSGAWLRCIAEDLWDQGPDAAPLYDRLRRQRVTIAIDGEPVELDVLLDPEADAWVGRSVLPSVILTVESRAFPLGALNLVRVTNLKSYLS